MYAYLALARQHSAFIGAGILLTFSSSFGQTFFISLFGGEIRSSFGLDHSGFGAIYSIGTLLSAACFIWAGKLVDHIKCSDMSSVVYGVLALSALLVAIAPNSVILALAIFGLRLSGQGLATHTALTAMAKAFVSQRGKAISLVLLGIPIGEIVFPLIAVAVLPFGRQASWLVFALIIVLFFLPLCRWLFFRSETKTKNANVANVSSAMSKGRSWTRGEVLCDLRFYLLLPGALVPAFVITGVFFHQVHIVATKGWNLTIFASAFTAYAMTSVAGSLLSGFMVDRYSARQVIRYFLPIMMIGCFALAFGDTELSVITLMAAFGLSQGGFSAALTALWAELYGTAYLGAIRALTTALMVFGSALSPFLLGLAFDTGASVQTVAVWCAIYIGFGSALLWPALRLRVNVNASA